MAGILAHPPDRVLMDFLYVTDALQYISDVVDSAFLHFEPAGCEVEIESEVGTLLDELDEFVGQG